MIMKDDEITKIFSELDEISDSGSKKPEKMIPRSVQKKIINDKEDDKHEELAEDEEIKLTKNDDAFKPIKANISNKSALPLCAIDTSSMLVGETNMGIISAVRGSIVVIEKQIKVEQFGPYVLHFTEKNKQACYDFFQQKIFNIKNKRKPPKLQKMTDRFRNFLERILQKYACTTISGGLVFFDGSLTAGTVDTPKQMLENIITTAKKRKNNIISISKRSWIKLSNGDKVIDVLDRKFYPCYVKIHDYLSPMNKSRVLGTVFACRFSHRGFTFRTDVNSHVPSKEEQALKNVYQCVDFYKGYPNVLRLAHMHCYFTKYELLAMQTYSLQKYGMRVYQDYDIRNQILSPFS